jgi:broad specificity phosphatase PhoE
MWKAGYRGEATPGLARRDMPRVSPCSINSKTGPSLPIYASTLQRSILTAQPIAQHFGLSIQKQSELDEIAFGILEGKQILNIDGEAKVEWERFRENRMTYRIPGAENFTDVAIRLGPFKEKILRNHEGQEILIIGHKIVNRFLIGILLEYPPEDVPKLEQTNGCVYLVERNSEARVSHFIDGEIREGFFFDPPR